LLPLGAAIQLQTSQAIRLLQHISSPHLAHDQMRYGARLMNRASSFSNPLPAFPYVFAFDAVILIAHNGHRTAFNNGG
jgi:hypothetical protein